MDLLHLSVFLACSVLIGLFISGEKRKCILLVLSIWAIFWLQPGSTINNLEFWLPICTLAITILSWTFVTPSENLSWRENWKSSLIIIFIVIVWASLPYLHIPNSLDLPITPMVGQAFLGLGLIVLVAGLLSRLPRSILLWSSFFTILMIFLIIKTPQLTIAASSFIRELTRQPIEQARSFDIRWIGFSYIGFRIIHTIRDRQSGKTVVASLSEYVTYVIFFPSLAAGPIDRLERFVKDIRKTQVLSDVDWLYAAQRVSLGMFKKFVLADNLALLALNSANATSVKPGLWTWAILYAYSFQIFFDFSGYTDIAIGIARMVGVNLPENFNFPYLKPNLTQFWNSWHITLTQWFRAYFFNPLTRALRSNQKLPVLVIILITQISTMVLIGIWHGVSLNFVLWGLWHGIGLFIQNRWSEFLRVPITNWASTPLRKHLVDASNIFFTFNFVTIGWIFFSLPTSSLAWGVISKLIH